MLFCFLSVYIRKSVQNSAGDVHSRFPFYAYFSLTYYMAMVFKLDWVVLCRTAILSINRNELNSMTNLMGGYLW